MNNTIWSLLALGFILSMTSCSSKLTPLTKGMVSELDWSEKDLKKIQFYLSKDVVLWRDLGTEESRIRDGRVKIVDGRKVEEVIFKKNTPGLVIFSPKGQNIAVSFDSSDEKYLMFGPSKKVNGRYVLLAKDWQKNRGKVRYNGKIYNTSSESAYANLLLDIKLAKSTEYRKQEASGRRI